MYEMHFTLYICHIIFILMQDEFSSLIRLGRIWPYAFVVAGLLARDEFVWLMHHRYNSARASTIMSLLGRVEFFLTHMPRAQFSLILYYNKSSSVGQVFSTHVS